MRTLGGFLLGLILAVGAVGLAQQGTIGDVSSGGGWVGTATSALGMATYYIGFGTDPADTGQLRLPGGGVIAFESSPSGADATITFDSSEYLTFAGATGLGLNDPVLLGTHATLTVNSTTALNLNNASASYNVLACTGAETINTITNAVAAGYLLVLEHSDSECTIADDDDPTAADAVNLTGTATNSVGAAGKTLILIYTGAHWQQIGGSAN